MMLQKKCEYNIVIVFMMICLTGASDSIYASIKKASSINFLLQELPMLDNQSLVVFDLDDTLIQGIAYAPENIKLSIRSTWYLINKMLEHASSDAQKALVYAKLFKMKPDLVEPDAPSIIRQLQQHGVKVIALTASCAGIYDARRHAPCNADMRVAHLKLIDINFCDAFAHVTSLWFLELQNQQEVPAFVGGVLFSRPSEKGTVLEAFLQKIKWMPNKIIFIDNLRDMVENVGQAAQKMNIPFLGIEFTGARNLPPLDPALFQLRVQYLMRHDVWLDGHDATALLNNPDYSFLKAHVTQSINVW